MSRIDDLRELSGEILRHATISGELSAAMDRLVSNDIPRIGRTTTTSLAVAGLIENYYTAHARCPTTTRSTPVSTAPDPQVCRTSDGARFPGRLR
jgi:hypothetical protein